jgi:hypothetical protein
MKQEQVINALLLSKAQIEGSRARADERIIANHNQLAGFLLNPYGVQAEPYMVWPLNGYRR